MDKELAGVARIAVRYLTLPENLPVFAAFVKQRHEALVPCDHKGCLISTVNLDEWRLVLIDTAAALERIQG